MIQTQLPAERLIDYDEMVKQLTELEQYPRVKIHVLGTSHAGRNIYLIIIGNPQIFQNLDYQIELSNQIYAPQVIINSLEDVEIVEAPLVELMKEARLPVSIHAGTFGFEAAQTEAVLHLAKELAMNENREIQRILDKLLILMVPMMNPDGRMLAIEQWKKYPRCPGWAGAGNLYGFFFDFHGPDILDFHDGQKKSFWIS